MRNEGCRKRDVGRWMRDVGGWMRIVEGVMWEEGCERRDVK